MTITAFASEFTDDIPLASHDLLIVGEHLPELQCAAHKSALERARQRSSQAQKADMVESTYPRVINHIHNLQVFVGAFQPSLKLFAKSGQTGPCGGHA